jgi:hypothetical protein
MPLYAPRQSEAEYVCRAGGLKGARALVQRGSGGHDIVYEQYIFSFYYGVLAQPERLF